MGGNYKPVIREIRIHSNEASGFDPEMDVFDVRIVDESGREYSADFVPVGFLTYVFDKNRKTGECAEGSYFCMPHMIVVERVDQNIVERTVNDLNAKGDLFDYFMEI